MLDENLEQIRLAAAKEVMYGNQDTDKIFPIDVDVRLTHYAIFLERQKYSDEAGHMISLKTTRQFIQPQIEHWENTFRSGKYFERYKGLKVTILHDPLKQQELEGLDPQRSKKASTAELRKLVGSAKSATDFAKPKKKEVSNG